MYFPIRMFRGSKMPKAKDLNKYSGVDVVAQSIFDAFAEVLNSIKSKQHRNTLVSLNSVSISLDKEQIGLIIDKFITPKGIYISVETYTEILSKNSLQIYTTISKKLLKLDYEYSIYGDPKDFSTIMTVKWGK